MIDNFFALLRCSVSTKR